MRVEESRPEDRSFFIDSWKAMLDETIAMQDPVIPIEQTINNGARRYDAYLNGQTLGMCQIVREEQGENVGFALWGDEVGQMPGMQEYATVWGLYLTPRHRKEKLANYVLEEARVVAKDMGYKGAQWTVNTVNPASLAVGQRFIENTGGSPTTIMSVFYRSDF